MSHPSGKQLTGTGTSGTRGDRQESTSVYPRTVLAVCSTHRPAVSQRPPRRTLRTDLPTVYRHVHRFLTTVICCTYSGKHVCANNSSKWLSGGCVSHVFLMHCDLAERRLLKNSLPSDPFWFMQGAPHAYTSDTGHIGDILGVVLPAKRRIPHYERVRFAFTHICLSSMEYVVAQEADRHTARRKAEKTTDLWTVFVFAGSMIVPCE
jgi:hypothetical protein